MVFRLRKSLVTLCFLLGAWVLNQPYAFSTDCLQQALNLISSKPSVPSSPLDLQQPLMRFALIHSRGGVELAKRVIGNRVETDADLIKLSKAISQRAQEPAIQIVISQLQLLEQRLRADLNGPNGIDGFLVRAGRTASETLAPDLSNSPISSELAPPSAAAPVGPGQDFSAQDLRQKDLQESDLRFAKFKGSKLGNMGATDLRGADLRGAQIDTSTNFEDSIYDQFTALPFSRAEARARGMRYVPSQPPEDFLFIDLERKQKLASKSAEELPVGWQSLASSVLRNMPTKNPKYLKGVVPFETPKFIESQGMSFVRFEAGKLTSEFASTELADLIAEVEGLGGEVRRVIFTSPKTGKVLNRGGAYFHLDGDLPTIGLSLSSDSTTMVHERQHMRDWIALYRRHLDQFKAERQKNPEKMALKSAKRTRTTAAYRTFTETNAVRMQEKEQARLDEVSGIPLAERKWRYEQRAFATTVSYPEREGMRVLFGKYDLEEIRADDRLNREAESYCRRIIKTMLNHRRSLFKNLKLHRAAEFTRQEFFYESIGGNAGRYAEDGTLESIQEFYDSLLNSEVNKLPDDEFKRAVLERLATTPSSAH